MSTAAGLGAGLRLGASDTGMWAVSVLWALGVVLALTALWAASRDVSARPARWRGRVVLLSVAAVMVAGVATGMPTASTAVNSCAARLRTGDGVIVEGQLDVSFPTPVAAEPWARGVVRHATLRHAGQTCRLPGLQVRLYRPDSPIPAGSHIRLAGEWRSFGSRSGGIRPVMAYGAVYGSRARNLVHPGPETRKTDLRPLRWLRHRAARKLEILLPPDVTPVAKALVLADRTDLSPVITRRFADAGVAHLLAISGLHVAILAGAALVISAFLFRGAGRYLLAAGLIAGYVLLIGAPPAAVRAGLIFAGYSLARARGSPIRSGDLLGLVAVIMLITDPPLMLRPGFQLSFAGFGGLIAGRAVGRRVLRILEARVRRIGGRRGRWTGRALTGIRGMGIALAASSGAFLSTAPVVAAHFGRIAPAAIFSSVIGAPLVALALTGLVPALLLPSALALPFADGATITIRSLSHLADFFARLPLHSAVSPPDTLAWLAVGTGLLGTTILVADADNRRPETAVARKGYSFLLLGAALAVWLAGPAVRAIGRGTATLVCSLDVGQGDAAVIRTRKGHWIVLDAGPGPGFGRGRHASSYDAGSRVVVPFLRAHGARVVDLFILSHPHMDHLGGAAAVFRAFPVRRVADAGYPVPSGDYLAFLQGVEEEGATWLAARDGARLRLDETELLVLAPEPDGVPSSLDPNDVSVVVRIRIDDSFVYLNMGDAPVEAESEILAHWPKDSLRADLLKVGHHGSRSSTSPQWLEATAPHVAIVSVGARNRYGHPHPATLARLDSAGVENVWRTDRQGTQCAKVRAGGRWRLVSA